MLVSDVATDALLELNIIANGETPKAAYLATCMRRYNMILDTWKAQLSMIYQLKRELLATVANQASYTIGPGGNWNIARPEVINGAGFVNTAVNPAQPLETPMSIYVDEEWQAIGLKTQTSTVPWSIWYETTFPLGTIHVNPVPTVVAQVALYVPTPMTEAATLATVLYMPPGYRALSVYAVARDIASSFERTVSRDLNDKYKAALTVVKRGNAKPMKLWMPRRLTARGGGYNILTNQGARSY